MHILAYGTNSSDRKYWTTNDARRRSAMVALGIVPPDLPTHLRGRPEEVLAKRCGHTSVPRRFAKERILIPWHMSAIVAKTSTELSWKT